MANIKDAASLKALQSRLEREKAERWELGKKAKDINNKVKECERRISKLELEIENFAEGELVVSEHAILRYLERVELIPVEEIPAKILTQEVIRIYNVIGGGKIPLGETGKHLVIKGNTVITIE